MKHHDLAFDRATITDHEALQAIEAERKRRHHGRPGTIATRMILERFRDIQRELAEAKAAEAPATKA